MVWDAGFRHFWEWGHTFVFASVFVEKKLLKSFLKTSNNLNGKQTVAHTTLDLKLL